ncbi:MAG: arylamine N-acetyltransferase [Gammaproteobacteria bacterium]|nr:arylamine N-acetyltransferase [Gammaproteobacteria bacterium]
MDKEKYLKRIGVCENVKPTLSNLIMLHEQHLLNIPFENWDIHDNIPIALDTSRLFDKIVNKKRGGFCYELNGLFYFLLTSLGFQAKLIAARVYSSDSDNYGPEFDHMAIVVTIDNSNYLVDIGFGEFILHPLKITVDKRLHDSRGKFIFKQDDYGLVIRKINSNNENESHQPLYLLNTSPRQLDDFAEMCHYHQTSPDSHFTSKLILSLATPNGRITISGNNLIIRNHDEITETVITEPFDSIIKKYFQPFPH